MKNKTKEKNVFLKEFLKIAKKIYKINGQNIDEIIKKAIEKTGIKINNYQYIKSMYDYKNIKENDTLIFNTDYKKLNDKKIYIFSCEVSDRIYLLYAEYNQELNSFVFENKPRSFLEVDENIKILGILSKIEKEN